MQYSYGADCFWVDVGGGLVELVGLVCCGLLWLLI